MIVIWPFKAIPQHIGDDLFEFNVVRVSYVVLILDEYTTEATFDVAFTVVIE